MEFFCELLSLQLAALRRPYPEGADSIRFDV